MTLTWMFGYIWTFLIAIVKCDAFTLFVRVIVLCKTSVLLLSGIMRVSSLTCEGQLSGVMRVSTLTCEGQLSGVM